MNHKNPFKILIVSQYFYPENFRGNDIAFELAKEQQVHVITAVPNYPDGVFYKGYGWFRRRREVIKGVKVTRIPVFARRSNHFSLMLNYFSFMVHAWIYILFHTISHKYDCVFVQQLSPVMMSAPAILYKKLRKVPLYTWVLDLWPESLAAAGGIKNRAVLNFFAHFAKMEYKWSDKLLISSRSFRKSILQYGDYAHKIVYFPQWAEDVFNNDTQNDIEIPKLKSGFRIMFAGAIGEAQGFDFIMQAALLTKEQKNIKWLIVGDGRKYQWVKDFIHNNNLNETVQAVGRFAIEEMPKFFKQADAMLVSLKETDIFRLTAPAKIQAYMAASKPIIAMLNGEGADIIKDANCGWSVPAEDATSLAKLVITLSTIDKTELVEKGQNGRAFYEEHFTKEKCLNNLKNIMNLH